MKKIIVALLACSIFVLMLMIVLLTNNGPDTADNGLPGYVATKDGRFVAPDKYAAWVYRYAAEYGVPVYIAIRLAYEESKWDENAVGHNSNGSTDYGLFQLNSRYHSVKPTEQNVKTAMEFLGQLIKESPTMRIALLKYNAGPHFYEKHGYWPKTSLAMADRIIEGGM